MTDEQHPQAGGFWRGLKEKLGFRNGETSLRESLEEALEEHEAESGAQEGLGETEREMLFNVLEYGTLRVNDVMVPRADIVSVQQDTSYHDLVKLCADAAHSRIPVYSKSLDEVQGMVHVKDVLKVAADDAIDGFRIPKIQRPVLFVPPSMKVIDLLAKMRNRRTHMAIVIDEYGGTDGLVTVEDIVEEVVGVIEDEHDDAAEEPVLMPLTDGGYDADARLEIAPLEEALGVDILPEEQDEDVDTVGGLVFTLAGRVPEIGEVIKHDSGHTFEVVDADPRRIQKVRIYPPSAGKAEDG